MDHCSNSCRALMNYPKVIRENAGKPNYVMSQKKQKVLRTYTLTFYECTDFSPTTLS